MKEEILKLRNEGKSYKEIVRILGCSKSTVCYHCGIGQKDKTKERTKNRRKNVLLNKLERFKCEKQSEKKLIKKKIKNKKDIDESIRGFQKKDLSFKRRTNKNIKTTFTWEDVINKFGENTECYLSGEKINLYENTYNLEITKMYANV